VCSKLYLHVQMKVAERGMNDSDEEFWAIYEACSKDEVKHAGWSDEWLWVMKMVWSEWRKVKSVCCDCEEAEQIRGHTDTVAEWYWEFCERDDFTFNLFRNYKPVKRFQSLGCVCVCACVSRVWYLSDWCLMSTMRPHYLECLSNKRINDSKQDFGQIKWSVPRRDTVKCV